jgi:hypothetical protein
VLGGLDKRDSVEKQAVEENFRMLLHNKQIIHWYFVLDICTVKTRGTDI